MAAMHKMDPLIQSVAAELTKSSISHSVLDVGTIRVPLPHNFAELEIGSLHTVEPDSIVSLVGHSWHTHGDVLSAENGGAGHVDSIVQFVRDIFEGRYLLIEESTPGRPARKIILQGLDRYLEYLPDGATYKIYNGSHRTD